MLSASTEKKGKGIALGAGVLLALAMGTAAFASKGLVQDRRIDLAQAREMAVRASSQSDFPIVVNDLVVTQLNRYIGTPEGREFMRDSLVRMQDHKDMVNNFLSQYRLPSELLAVPIIESGYRNLDESHNPTAKGAGLWQFIPSTARNFGLRVDNQKDERLNVQILTDAAMRYLQSNNLRFKDWHLATLAYYLGENAVQKHMDRLKTRDAWEILRSVPQVDDNYLPMIMAAILIMNNPESVE